MPDRSTQTVFVEYGNQRIQVLLGFENRRRLSVSVHPDGSVTALAPADIPLAQVASRLKRKRSWVARQLHYFTAFHPLPVEKHFLAGETHLYLGRQYRLRMRSSAEVNVKLIGRHLDVFLPSPQDPQSVRLALDSWYRKHAAPIYRDRMERFLDDSAHLRRLNPQLRIRQMRCRWGSCSRTGTITLSLELIKAPLHCIEYVIMHELCHMRIHDHSPAFFRLLSRYMPDWERRKAHLDAVVLR